MIFGTLYINNINQQVTWCQFYLNEDVTH